SSLGGQVYFILNLIIFGLTSGAAVITAQYWGKGDVRTIEKVLGIALRVALFVSILFTLAAWIIPRPLMRLFTNEEEVIAQGISYLRVIAFSYVLACLTMTYLNIMRSVERVLIATVVYSVSLLVNVVLNAVFIFGMFGVPAMGVAGAALGTVCARGVEFCIVVYYARKKNDTVRFRMKDLFVKDKL